MLVHMWNLDHREWGDHVLTSRLTTYINSVKVSIDTVNQQHKHRAVIGSRDVQYVILYPLTN